MDGGGGLLRPVAIAAHAGDGSAFLRSPRSAWRLPAILRASLSRRSSVSSPPRSRLPRHLGTVLTLTLYAGIGAYGLAAGGHYPGLRDAYGEPRDLIARILGLGIDRITISGLSQLREKEILDAAGISPRTSLAFTSAADVRARLEAVPLISHASVRKLYPHNLVVNLTEREPYALWQRNGEVFVVAADGTVIDLFQDARFAGLPLVVGDEANGRAADYLALLEAAGPIRSRIRAGMLISGRRWNLKMDNGLEIRLPELGAVAAGRRLARLDREQKLLDKDVLAIDLRMSDRIVVRLSEEASAARAELVKKRPNRGNKAVDT